MKKCISLAVLLILCIKAFSQSPQPYISSGITSLGGIYRYNIEIGVGNSNQKAAFIMMKSRSGDTVVVNTGFRGYSKLLKIKNKVYVDAITGGYIAFYNHLTLQLEAGASLRYPISNKFSLQINESFHTYASKIGGLNSSGLFVSYYLK